MSPKKTSRVPKLLETTLLRAALNGDKPVLFWWSKHGRAEMVKDRVEIADVKRVCRRGSVTWVEWKQDELWHVEGSDLDGRSIRVVISLIEDEEETVIKVVTAMTL